MNVSLSRRNFLTGAASLGAVAAMGITGCSPRASADSADAANGQYPEYDIAGRLATSDFTDSAAELDPITSADEEESYDVVVIGAGVAGLPAAISAFEQGANVCLLQKESSAIGQGSGFACINPESADDLGIIHFAHSIRDFSHLQPNFELIRLWAQNNCEAIAWYVEKMQESGMVQDTDFTIKDLQTFDYPEGSVSTKMHDVTGGMQSAVTALAEQFGDSVNIHYKCPGVQLIQEDGKVVGVYARKKDGTVLRVNAAKGVILATGDYQNNEAMVAKYCPTASLFDKKQSNKTGDGHLMGMMVGGAMQRIGHTKMIHAKNWGANATAMKSSPLLAVDGEGNRFCAEDVTMYYRNNMVRNVPGRCWNTIMDSNYPDQVTAMGFDKVVKAADLEAIGEDGGVYKADTIEELAEKMGIDAANLQATVDRYNQLVSDGSGDLDFGKPTEYMMPIDTPPFYGLHREYAVSAITSGLEINGNAQVLDSERNPIEGLYAIGNCSGPFYGTIDYLADVAGLSLSRAITFGYVIGKQVATM